MDHARLITTRGTGRVNSAIDLNMITELVVFADARGGGDFFQHLRHEGLAAETGHHRHAEQQVDPPEKRPHRIQRRGGVERESRLETGFPDAAQRFRDVVLGLDVHGDQIGPGVDEALEVMIRPGNHQVRVEKDPARPVGRRHHLRAEGDVVHEVAIHHIQVHPVRPRSHRAPDFAADVGEIRRQQRGGDHAVVISLAGIHGPIRTTMHP